MFNINKLTDNESKVQWLLDQTHANDGLAPLDIDKFWADQEVARADPFGKEIPQVSLGIMMSGECVYDELGIAEDYKRYEDDQQWRLGLHKAYNDISEKVVGRRLLTETWVDPAKQYKGLKGLHDVFEAKNIWHGQSWWLQQSATNEDELKALLDRVEQKDIRQEILPEDWQEQKARLVPEGIRSTLYHGQRGPVTFATSIYGPENLIFLIMDNPDLARRFSNAILKVMLEIGEILGVEAGYAADEIPHGFAFLDDNCTLLNAQMYELFGYPVLQGMFDRFSPDAGDKRYQHSDSDMGHLLPLLGKVGLTETNFGPNVMCDEIREHLPNAVIHGELAPFTFSRHEEGNIVRQFLRDFDMTREGRGLNFMTAGSINNGSRLTGMRLIMSAIQHFGRFD